jgi:hypothetical protein
MVTAPVTERDINLTVVSIVIVKVDQAYMGIICVGEMELLDEVPL